jgi:L-ascorbate metabolism protein UlaG (beta-lactamase superfamily)
MIIRKGIKRTTRLVKAFVLVLLIGVNTPSLAHQATATYVANEAVLITAGDKKVLFDPFFHQAFGTYQLVPKETKQAIFAGQAPFDGITVIVISHAHADHFAADEVLTYLQKYPSTQLVAPEQAVTELMALAGAKQIQPQVTSVKLAFKQTPKTFAVAGLTFDAVRIPHAGWPGRAEVENLVFRVTVDHENSPITLMHMGDADPDDQHYLPFKQHWQSRLTDTAFPPYWFYLSAEGRDILKDILNIKESVGIHVPLEVPNTLKNSGEDYFSKPGESRTIGSTHQH